MLLTINTVFLYMIQKNGNNKTFLEQLRVSIFRQISRDTNKFVKSINDDL